MLQEVEKPGSDIDFYVENLCKILVEKRTHLSQLKRKVDEFRQHLAEEHVLSSHCTQRQFEQDNEEGNDEFGAQEGLDPSNKENFTNDDFRQNFL